MACLRMLWEQDCSSAISRFYCNTTVHTRKKCVCRCHPWWRSHWYIYPIPAGKVESFFVMTMMEPLKVSLEIGCLFLSVHIYWNRAVECAIWVFDKIFLSWGVWWVLIFIILWASWDNVCTLHLSFQELSPCINWIWPVCIWWQVQSRYGWVWLQKALKTRWSPLNCAASSFL